MKNTIQTIGISVLLCGLTLTGSAQASATGPEADPYWGPIVKQGQAGTAPATAVVASSTSQADDPYWGPIVKQALPSMNMPYAQAIVIRIGVEGDPYWGPIVMHDLPPTNLPYAAAIVIRAGVEGDPYWGPIVKQGQPEYASATVASLPDELPAGTWRLVESALVSSDGTVSQPLGEKLVGYLLISPDRYAAIVIAPAEQSANPASAMNLVTSFVGKLNYEGDQSIHPVVNINPAMIGVDQVKTWSLKDGKLTMTTPPNTTDQSFNKLVWELVK